MTELTTGVGLWSSRHVDPKIAAQFGQILEADPRVDQCVVWDQLMNWFPQALWEPANTPLAAMFPDVDSLADPFLVTAFALSAVERLGFAICCDALRRDPAEMAQSLLTLAMATEGKASLFLADRHLVADVSGLIVETDPALAFQRLGDICGHVKSVQHHVATV